VNPFGRPVPRAGRTSHRSLAAALVAVWIGLFVVRPPIAAQAPSLPARLSDQQFWALSRELSEPNGFFRSENLVSNEHTFQNVIPALKQRVKPGGVYLGVAPDQNFTYIVATQPRMAFIVDVRRGNLLLHLMYKAIIELSADRAEFLSRLFSKERPRNVAPTASAEDLFEAFRAVRTSDVLYRQNVKVVQNHLVKRHGVELSADDLEQLDTIYFSFFWEGPGLRYSTAQGFGGRGRNFPTYQDLMVQTDWEGVPRSYLSSETSYRCLKSLEEKNLIVPVVGNFAGPKALRAVGRYVRQRGATVKTFYVSNVEQYLFQDGLFNQFVRNVSTLPLDATSTFIRSVSIGNGYVGELLGPDGRATALDPMQSFVRDFAAGEIRSYADVNRRSQ
jgi:hypothetical protein